MWLTCNDHIEVTHLRQGVVGDDAAAAWQDELHVVSKTPLNIRVGGELEQAAGEAYGRGFCPRSEENACLRDHVLLVVPWRQQDSRNQLQMLPTYK